MGNVETLEEFVLNFLTHVRPKEIKLEEYPYVVEMVVNMIKLELTKDG